MLSNIEKALYSYNHAVSTLNAKCESLVGTKTAVTDVRCAGSNPVNKNIESSTNCTLSELQTWPTSGTYPSGSFNNIAKDEDTIYQTDYNRLLEMAYVVPDNRSMYWLASRDIMKFNGWAEFHIHCGAAVGGVGFGDVFHISENGVSTDTYPRGLRPVITLSSGVLNSASGTGTLEDPYIIQ